MASNKRDYQSMGARHARMENKGTNLPPRPYPRESKSWQAVAWWEGYDSHKTDVGRAAVYDAVVVGNQPVTNTGRIVNEAEQNQRLLNTALDQQQTLMQRPRDPGKATVVRGIVLAEIASGIIKLPEWWPAAAKAHAVDLARQYATEQQPRRAGRLVRGIHRLFDRHELKRPATNFILSTDESKA